MQSLTASELPYVQQAIDDEQLAVLVGYGLIESEGIEGRYRANKDNSEIVANYILNGEPIPQKPQQGK